MQMSSGEDLSRIAQSSTDTDRHLTRHLRVENRHACVDRNLGHFFRDQTIGTNDRTKKRHHIRGHRFSSSTDQFAKVPLVSYWRYNRRKQDNYRNKILLSSSPRESQMTISKSNRFSIPSGTRGRTILNHTSQQNHLYDRFWDSISRK